MESAMQPFHEPFERIKLWIEEAKKHSQIAEPTAMSLATADVRGMPSLRVVLMRGMDERGLVFFTNSESQKGCELKQNPQACLNFYWMLGRQIRVSGKVERVDDAESDAYFASRRWGSRIASMASDQSRPLVEYQHYLDRVTTLEREWEGQEPPRPPHWHGWRVIPEQIEFWQEGEFRMHHRELYTREGEGWRKGLLYP
jgi:pyridoxamine 5'-phosphate oxidase